MMNSDTGRPGPLSFFRGAFAVTALGVVLAGFVGWSYGGSIGAAATALLIALILAVLEISLSFDNAIVNANKLKDMRPEWQRRFLTWGILIAVFGMRLVFPLLIIMIAAGLNPWDALVLAATRPDEYAYILGHAHLQIAAFGGTFLFMVAFNYFFDGDKDVHWFAGVERPLAGAAAARGIEVAVVLALALGTSQILDDEAGQQFLHAAIWGLMTYLLVDAGGTLLDRRGAAMGMAKGGFGAFLYLEMLDASFSFDGVIGAFALTPNIFIIAIGLGIGAMYVRSMTVMLVARGTLTEYRYLEHGAFYAIFALALIMYIQTFAHVPELVTGLVGAGFILLSYRASLKFRRLHGDVCGAGDQSSE